MSRAEEWVLLAYRLPRVPSTPRSAVWRKLKRLGVAQQSDGLVALPADARTREQLEWISFEAIVSAYDLTADPALEEIGQLVHEADLTNHETIDITHRLFDGLYEHTSRRLRTGRPPA
jgi:hypothetical protein